MDELFFKMAGMELPDYLKGKTPDVAGISEEVKDETKAEAKDQKDEKGENKDDKKA